MGAVFVSHPCLQHARQFEWALHLRDSLHAFWSGVQALSDGEKSPFWLPKIEDQKSKDILQGERWQRLKIFEKQELQPFSDKVYSVLRKGGRDIHVPNGESPFGTRMYFWDFTRGIEFARISMVHLLKSSGILNMIARKMNSFPMARRAGSDGYVGK